MTTSQNGLVVLEITDSLGCVLSHSFNVETPILGDPDFETSSVGYSTYGVYSIFDPIQFTNLSSGDYVSINWDFGDGNYSSEENPIHTYTIEGTYVVTQTVTYPSGCIYTHVISLLIEKGYKLMMPNAFTPNQDGVNDYFGPVYIGLFDIQLDVYDTWGSLIYSETGDNIQGWNGEINNHPAENGNYYFKLKAKTFYNKEILIEGAFVYLK